MFVYIINDARGRTKVGRSNKPKARLADLQHATALTLKLEHAFQCGAEAQRIEKEAHRLLVHWRVRGEWFSCIVGVARVAIEAAKENCDRRREFIRRLVEVEKAEHVNPRDSQPRDQLAHDFPDIQFIADEVEKRRAIREEMRKLEAQRKAQFARRPNVPWPPWMDPDWDPNKSYRA